MGIDIICIIGYIRFYGVKKSEGEFRSRTLPPHTNVREAGKKIFELK